MQANMLREEVQFVEYEFTMCRRLTGRIRVSKCNTSWRLTAMKSKMSPSGIFVLEVDIGIIKYIYLNQSLDFSTEIWKY